MTAGAEALSADIVERARELLPGVEIANSYGPTEATIACAFYKIGRSIESRAIESKAIPIGRAISNLQVYVLDTGTRFVPTGAVGEIHTGGHGLAWGYLNRPDLTAERFVPNPYSGTPGERLYKTGDVGRCLPDGNVEFAGRTDNQVKVHGFRVELEEIESVLRRHPGIRDAVVIGRQDGGRVNGLIGCIVPSHGYDFDSDDYQSYLRDRVPDYMVPSIFLRLEELPLTASGKIDRKVLLSGDVPQIGNEPAYAPPVTKVQKQLAEVWTEALGVEKVGITDNFFALGGDSIISIQVVSRARQAGLDITHKQVFQHPTIAELSQLAAESQAYSNEVQAPTAPRTYEARVERSSLVSSEILSRIREKRSGIEDVYPVTHAQEGMLFHS
ncbi:MAG: non-ribosomal peptide synthetase, partial [Blastocatellia bacterium]